MNETSVPEPLGTETLVAGVTDEFMERLRRGDRPEVDDYARRYPQIASVLRHVLPALQVIGSSASGRLALLAESAADIHPEAPLGDYRIVREIGRGGMGVVYQAVQISLGREVALKVLPFAAAMDSKQLQRFKNEAQAAAHLHHTNIVPVYGVGCERGVHYYAMQYIEGQTMAAVIAELRRLSGRQPETSEDPAGPAAEVTRELASGRWAPGSRSKEESPRSALARGPDGPSSLGLDVATTDAARSGVSSTQDSTQNPAYIRTVANLGVQAARALEHAHSLGVIHRDIKPANLIVDLRGNLWITDFGLARLQDGADLTVTGDLVGTLRYMSPEQALVQRAGVDHRTDVYSLGMTLYELLTLEPAFGSRDRRELLRQIAFEEPRRLLLLNKAVPADLETIVLKAIEKDLTGRYATAQDLADDLQRFMDDKPIRARRPTILERARKWARRHRPVVVTAAVAGVVLLAVVSVVATVAAFWVWDVRNATLNQLAETQKAQKEGRRQLYEAKLAQAKASRWSGRAGRRFEGLLTLTEAARLAQDLHSAPESILTLRNEAIACMALADLRLDQKWRGYPPGSTLTGIAFDRDMNHYARIDENGHITVRRMADNQETVHIVDIGAPASPGRAPDWRVNLLFSPDGQFLATAGRPESPTPLQVWDLKGPKSLLKAGPAGGFERVIDFRPDGCVLVARGPDRSSIRLFDVRAARELNHFSLGRNIECLRFHPDGDRIAVSLGSEVRVFDLAGRPLMRTLTHPSPARALSWSADGRLLATACDDGQAYVWDIRTGKPQAICPYDPTQELVHVAFNQRGDLLATVSDGTRLWDPWSGKELLSTGSLASDFSRDDRWLGLGVFGAEVGRWEVASSGEYRPLHGHSHGARIRSLDISPDGWLLASAADDGVRLWDLAAGKEVAILPTGRTESAVWDTSGRFLLTAAASGLHRWPIRFGTGPMSARLHLGPAEPIRLPPANAAPVHQASMSGDGRTIVVTTRRGGAIILDLDRPGGRPRLIHHAVSSFGLSPDARWVATNADNAFESKLWDARNGNWVRGFPGMRTARVAFSPDNRWLVFGTAQEYIFYHVGSWQPGPRWPRDYAGYSPCNPAFTRTGNTVAIAHSSRAIKLLDVESGSELATLAAPGAESLTSLCFTPDGGRLAAGTRTGVIQLWDLRRIRQQLREMGLDWDPPAQPSQSLGGGTTVQVAVDLGELPDLERSSILLALFPLDAEAYYRRGLAYAQLDHLPEALDDFRRALALKPDHPEAHYHRGLVQSRQGKTKEAIADWSRAIALKPDHAEAYVARGDAYFRLSERDEAARDYVKVAELHPDWPEYQNQGAWLLATHPDPRRRDPGRAVGLARRAVELEPDEGMYWNTLGVALYRAGHWKEAMEALNRSLGLMRGQFESFDAFFLAMAHWQMGDQGEARPWYNRAVQWMEQHRPNDEELRRFRAEASELLGIGDPIRSAKEKGVP
jgi:serine/threonine protein kinase/WD40 repeat protein/Flp pilus assembly protein TadD